MGTRTGSGELIQAIANGTAAVPEFDLDIPLDLHWLGSRL